MAKETRAAKRAHWEGVLAQWRESGLSKAAFCREHEIRPRQFRYWFEHLAPGPDPSPAFAPVHCGGGSGVRIRLRSGLAVEVETDFDPATLMRVLQAVASPC